MPDTPPLTPQQRELVYLVRKMMAREDRDNYPPCREFISRDAAVVWDRIVAGTL
jgi:hypothetical protein